MDFRLSDEQVAIKDSVRQFADLEMVPLAAIWDKEHIFPIEVLRKAAALGLAGICVSAQAGGSNLSRIDAAIIFEALASACPSTAAYLSIHNMVCSMIDKFATNEQKQLWLLPLLSMEAFASYCLTEPESGSDAAALKTTAVSKDDYYLVNGAKAFISGASVSDVYLCMVRTGEEGPHGISCLLIHKDTPGVHFGKKEEKLGWHSQPTTMVFFENCKVPKANLIGGEGQGFKIALSGLNGGRLNIAACSLGGAQACIDKAKQYMVERKQFGKRLADFQALQFKLVDMITECEAARLLVYKAAELVDRDDEEAILFCAMAKRFATDVGFKICDEALQLFGGYGYLQDYPIERYFRDLRVHRILEGSNEIMRLVAARKIFADLG